MSKAREALDKVKGLNEQDAGDDAVSAISKIIDILQNETDSDLGDASTDEPLYWRLLKWVGTSGSSGFSVGSE